MSDAKAVNESKKGIEHGTFKSNGQFIKRGKSIGDFGSVIGDFGSVVGDFGSVIGEFVDNGVLNSSSNMRL